MVRQHGGGALKRSLVSSTSVAVLVLGWMLATPAAAQIAGGDGTDGSSPGGGGAGGAADIGNPTGDGGTGGNGGVGVAGTAGGGPLGGAASTPAGGGGAESGGGGGSASGGSTGGGGGGGGGRGATFNNANISILVPATGGNGGDGGNGAGATGNGGGGGGGGTTIVFGGTDFITINPGSTITGGNGGNGGLSVSTGGSGGAGGNGIVTTVAGVTLNINAAVTGGNGGAGGPGGANGAGGVGITGVGMTVNLGSTVSGGLSGDGVTRANAINFTGGTNVINFSGASSGLTGNIAVAGGTLQLNAAVGGTTVNNVITGGGGLIQNSANTLTLGGANTYTGDTVINSGTIVLTNLAALGGTFTRFSGGTLRASVSGALNKSFVVQTGGASHIVAENGVTLDLSGGSFNTQSNVTAMRFGEAGNTGTIVFGGPGVINGAPVFTLDVLGGTLRAANNLLSFFTSNAVATNVAAGATLDFANQLSTIRNLQSAGTVNSNTATLLIGGGQVSGAITGSAGLTVASPGVFAQGGNTGALVLTGTNSYTGNTTINAGATLIVNGSTASSALTTVNAGGTLGGNGTVGSTNVNAGGTLSPGNSIGLLTVQGSLVFAAASSYLVEVSPSNADLTNVTGNATLGGATVNANFAAGSYVNKQYTILHANGGVTGTFAGPVVTNLPAGFQSNLSYDANNAYLNLILGFGSAGSLNQNQQNVANALTNFFNTTGGIPAVFGTLTPAGLTQVSGETAVGSQQTTFNAMNLFMGVMTDPFIAGRGDPVSGGGSPNAYAQDESLAYAARRKPGDAMAAIYTKAPPVAPVFEQRWSVWAAGFGGSQTTDGNTIVGSNNTRSSLAAGAVGADYRISPNTLAGFALAGGGTHFSVNGAGSGRSDLFQAGAFIRHNVGPAYITGALAYGWQDITTDRTVTVAGVDRLRAQFNANAWSGRIEGGYRFVAQGFGWTPYAAGQFTTFELPAYAEQAIVGANTFALTYNSKSVTDTRSELGLRTDKSFAVTNGIFTLRGRAAWAHDFNPDRAIGATFQTLPGASFVVNGARQAADAALVTGSAEMKWINGWSAAATFEGEFSTVTESYAGKGVVRYAW